MGKLDRQDFEQLLDRLIDGDLDAAEQQSLVAGAAEDELLSRELKTAQAFQKAMQDLPQERAPASLSRKLAQIPRRDSRSISRWWLQPRWAFAAILVVSVLTGSELYQEREARLEQQVELEQARQDLALVLAYLDKVNRNASVKIQSTVNEVTAEPVARLTTETLLEQLPQSQEFEL